MSRPRYEEKMRVPTLDLVLVPPRKAYLNQTKKGGKTAWYWCNPGKHISNKEIEEKLLSTGSTQESISQTKKNNICVCPGLSPTNQLRRLPFGKHINFDLMAISCGEQGSLKSNSTLKHKTFY